MRGNKRGIICLFVIDIKTKTKKIQHLWSTDPFSLQPVHAFFFLEIIGSHLCTAFSKLCLIVLLTGFKFSNSVIVWVQTLKLFLSRAILG